MRNIILHLILMLFVQNICCNEELLSKFHQHGYKIKDFRIQLMEYSKDYFNIFEIKAFKYNRTTTAHNATASYKVDVLDKVEVVVQIFKFLSNEYRHFLVRYQVNVKKAVDANVAGLSGIALCGNLTTFYFHKDITYHLCNFVIDETYFPPLFPNGKFIAEATLLYSDDEISVVNCFLEIYTPIAYPKK